MTLLYLVAAWAAGIFLASSSHAAAGFWVGLAAASLILACLVRRSRRLALICGALFMLGAARYAWATRPLEANHVAHYADTGRVTLVGVIVQDPDVRDNSVNLRVEAESLTQEGKKQPVQGLVLVEAPRYGQYVYGDRISATGQLLTPPEYDDFSYRDYLARQGIHVMMPYAQVKILAHDQGQPWTAAMYSLKSRAQRAIDRLLPSPEAPLLSGILLGVESSIPADVRDAFNRTGTSHIIAISGANIIVVMRVLMGLLTPGLGKRRAGWGALLGVTFYTLFVGADPAVVRAAIMGSLAVLASQLGRRTYGLTSLAFAIWLMTLWNPLTLWDIGFQLSVASTAGLVLFSDDLTHGLESLLRRGFAQTTARQITQWLAEPVVVSLAAQITTTPLILLYFGRLSVISLLANILIVPVQAYIMTLGWLAVIPGMIWPVLGEPMAWIVWIPLTYTIEVVRRLGSFEWASVTVRLSPSYAWGVYVLLFGVALMSVQHPEDRAALFQRLQRRFTVVSAVAAGGIVAILVWAMALTQPDGRLHVWFLDVGDGNAVLIQTPKGAQILIDGGPNPTRLRRAVGDALPFWDHDLDLLIVTQPQSSTINALPTLLDRYHVKLALTNGQADNSDPYRALVRAWQKQHVDVLTVTAGYQVETGDGVRLEILHPQQSPGPDTEAGVAALVIRVSYRDTSVLITSDLTAAAEQEMISAGWYVGSSILELPSQGSRGSNSAALIQAVHPQAAVVMVGAGNRSGLPAPDVVEQVQTIAQHALYRTDQQGTIEVVTDGHTLWIYSQH